MSTDLHSLFDAIQRGDKREIASHLIPSLSSPDGQHGRKSALSGAQHELSGEGQPTAGPGTAGAVTCRARYYEAASTILEDELRLHTHDNANELGGIIEAWLAKKRGNWEPR